MIEFDVDFFPCNCQYNSAHPMQLKFKLPLSLFCSSPMKHLMIQHNTQAQQSKRFSTSIFYAVCVYSLGFINVWNTNNMSYLISEKYNKECHIAFARFMCAVCFIQLYFSHKMIKCNRIFFFFEDIYYTKLATLHYTYNQNHEYSSEFVSCLI